MQSPVERLIARVSSYVEFVAEPKFIIAVSLAAALWRDQEGSEEAEEVLSLICGYKQLKQLRRQCGTPLEPLAIRHDEFQAIFGADTRRPIGNQAQEEEVALLFERSDELRAMYNGIQGAIRGTLSVTRVADAWKRPMVQLATTMALYTTDDLKLCTACLGEITRTDERRLALLQTEVRDARTLEAGDLVRMIQIMAAGL